MAQGRCCTPALVLLVVWTARHVADASQLTHPHHAQALRSRPSAHDSSHLRRQSLKTVGTSTGFVLPATQCSAPMNASDLISVGVLQLNEDVGSYEFKQVLTLCSGLAARLSLISQALADVTAGAGEDYQTVDFIVTVTPAAGRE